MRARRIWKPRVRRALVVTVCLAALGGCGGFTEVAAERTEAAFGGTPRVARAAPAGPAVAPAPGRRGTLRLIVHDRLSEGDTVGELFSQHGGPPIAIAVTEDPDQALERDVEERLRALGFDVLPGEVGGDGVPTWILELAWTRLWAQPTGAGLLELRGRLDARAAFVATLRQDSEPVWSAELEGRAELRPAYFRARDSEEVLGLAYGRALSALVEALGQLEWP